MRLLPNLHARGPITALGSYSPKSDTSGAYACVDLIDEQGPDKAWTIFVDTPQRMIEMGAAIEREGRRLSAEMDEAARLAKIGRDAMKAEARAAKTTLDYLRAGGWATVCADCGKPIPSGHKRCEPCFEAYIAVPETLSDQHEPA